MATSHVELAVDMSNWSGVPTAEQVAELQANGATRAIIGLQNGEIARGQYDALKAGGIERLDAYVYLPLPAGSTPAKWGARVTAALAELEGRVIGKLWLDCEDPVPAGMAQMTVIAHISAAAVACEGIVNSGIYTRKDWWVMATGDSSLFSSYPLWNATNRHGADYVPPAAPGYGGWLTAEMEQYWFDYPVVGFNVDWNQYLVENAAPPSPPDPLLEELRAAEVAFEEAWATFEAAHLRFIAATDAVLAAS